MALGQSLRAVVGQFGGAHGDYYDDAAFAAPAESARGDEAPRRERGGSADYDAIYRDESRLRPRQARQRDARPLALVRPSRIEFSLVTPQDFDDAQQIADRLRADGPVIVDMGSCGRELSTRLTDFCSGLTYALECSLQYIGETVVLLVPHNVELSSEAPGGLHERRFFNQV
jgi:cell division inhibitor SepF